MSSTLEGVDVVDEDGAHLLVADGNKTIAVWAWADAPETFKKLVTSSGAETWVALVPANYAHPISWIEQSSYFGDTQIDKLTLESGQTLYIGS